MCLASHLASHRAGNQLDGTSQSEILRSMLGTAQLPVRNRQEQPARQSPSFSSEGPHKAVDFQGRLGCLAAQPRSTARPPSHVHHVHVLDLAAVDLRAQGHAPARQPTDARGLV
jgi:hypothetical protein